MASEVFSYTSVANVMIFLHTVFLQIDRIRGAVYLFMSVNACTSEITILSPDFPKISYYHQRFFVCLLLSRSCE